MTINEFSLFSRISDIHPFIHPSADVQTTAEKKVQSSFKSVNLFYYFFLLNSNSINLTTQRISLVFQKANSLMELMIFSIINSIRRIMMVIIMIMVYGWMDCNIKPWFLPFPKKKIKLPIHIENWEKGNLKKLFSFDNL